MAKKAECMKKNVVDIKPFLKGKKKIFDVGTGPAGSSWWKDIDKDAHIEGIDMYFFPKKIPPFIDIYKYDADDLGKINSNLKVEKYGSWGPFKNKRVNWVESFDMVVANHVLEHVKSPQKVVHGIYKMLKPKGIVYAGFPDSSGFTDIFYHLIHPNGGGHIQMLTKKSVLNLFKSEGFKLLSCTPWPDDWLWFQQQYNWRSYMWPENVYLNQQKIDYLAEIFRKELTVEKGYQYGWEMVFKKK